jgi:L-alanine-DL-glutamate epimerase-like enolase superfamily enzyme
MEQDIYFHMAKLAVDISHIEARAEKLGFPLAQSLLGAARKDIIQQIMNDMPEDEKIKLKKMAQIHKINIAN